MTAKKISPTLQETATQDWMTPILELQKNSLDPLRWFGSAWLDSATEINRELADFLSKRIQEDVKTQHAMLNCSEPAKLQEIQAKFVQRAIEDYSAETGTLVKLNQAFMDRMKDAGKD